MTPLISRDFLPSRPQELGKIKIGRLGAERNKRDGSGTFRLPEKVDHFIVTLRDRDPKTGNFVKDEVIHSHPDVGEAPTELAGVLMFETVEQNLHTEMVEYRGRTKVVSCDGKTRTDLKTGACTACPSLPGKPACKCKPYGRFHIQLWASPDTYGFHVFRTTSWETVNNFQSALERIVSDFGTLFKAPVRLKIYPAEDTYTENGETKTSTSWKVGLVLAMSVEQAARQMIEAKRTLDETRQLLGGEPLRITAGKVLQDLDDIDVIEGEAIADEFFPPEEERPVDRLEARMKALESGDATDAEDPEPEEQDVPGFAALDAQLEAVLTDARGLDQIGMDGEAAVQQARDEQDVDAMQRWVTALSARVTKARKDHDDTTGQGEDPATEE